MRARPDGGYEYPLAVRPGRSAAGRRSDLVSACSSPHPEATMAKTPVLPPATCRRSQPACLFLRVHRNGSARSPSMPPLAVPAVISLNARRRARQRVLHFIVAGAGRSVRRGARTLALLRRFDHRSHRSRLRRAPRRDRCASETGNAAASRSIRKHSRLLRARMCLVGANKPPRRDGRRGTPGALVDDRSPCRWVLPGF